MKAFKATLQTGLILLSLAFLPERSHGQTYTTLDDPLGVRTEANSISGGNIVGFYADANSVYGFVYNGSSFTTLNFSPSETIAYGITGNNVVGFSRDPDGSYYDGFLYTGSGSPLYLNDPLSATQTSAQAISGNEIVGYFVDTGLVTHGFLYNITTASYATLDDPLGGNATVLNGISGNNIVGYSSEVGVSLIRSFLYNGSTWTTISDALGVNGTFANGISGNNIVGYYLDGSNVRHGFLYDGSSYTTIDDPLGVGGTVVQGIDGDNIVGYYYDGSGNTHGFLVTVPEPSALLLAGFSVVGFLISQRCRHGAPRKRFSFGRFGRPEKAKSCLCKGTSRCLG